MCEARAAQPADRSARLHLVGDRPVVEGVFLGGQGPFRFLVDTGAETNQLDARIARRLGLVPTFQVEMVTATGARHVPGARLPNVTLGSVTAAQQEFLFVQMEDGQRLSAGIEGTLGQEFLSRFDYLLDFAHRRLVFGTALPAGGRRVDFTIVHGRPAIQTSEGRLILDSGTDSLVLFRSVAPVVGGGGGAQLLTNAGASAVEVLRNVPLKIDGKCYRAPAVAVLASSSGREGGLLPASLFRAVYVCNSGRYVVLNPGDAP